MGLSICYSFTTTEVDPAEVRRLVESLRERALELPFQEVGELSEFGADVTNGEEVHPWLAIQSDRYLQQDDVYHSVSPRRCFAFVTDPGEGSESANFGLAMYPDTLTLPDGTRLPTNLQGWSWSCCCKTQYASNPEHGGLDNFLKCHLLIVQLLDHAQSLGLVMDVNDDTHYWDHRDQAELTREIGKWNRLIAGFAGRLQDKLNLNIQAPIKKYPNFEHLEADGRADEEE